MAEKTIAQSITPQMLADYMDYRISSKAVGEALGFHPVAVRRAIKRPVRPKQTLTKSDLIESRRKFRATLAHMFPREIAQIANVSLATANRIRAKRDKNV